MCLIDWHLSGWVQSKCTGWVYSRVTVSTVTTQCDSSEGKSSMQIATTHCLHTHFQSFFFFFLFRRKVKVKLASILTVLLNHPCCSLVAHTSRSRVSLMAESHSYHLLEHISEPEVYYFYLSKGVLYFYLSTEYFCHLVVLIVLIFID